MKSLIITWQGFQDQEVVYPYYRLREEAVSPDDVVLMSNVIGKINGILGVNMDSTALTDELKDSARIAAYLSEFDLLVIPGGVKALENCGRKSTSPLSSRNGIDKGKLLPALVMEHNYSFPPKL